MFSKESVIDFCIHTQLKGINAIISKIITQNSNCNTFTPHSFSCLFFESARIPILHDNILIVGISLRLFLT